jgi:hypothetical protein
MSVTRARLLRLHSAVKENAWHELRETARKAARLKRRAHAEPPATPRIARPAESGRPRRANRRARDAGRPRVQRRAGPEHGKAARTDGERAIRRIHMAREDDEAPDAGEDFDAEGTAGTAGDEDAMMEGESAAGGAARRKAPASTHRNTGGSVGRRKGATSSAKRKTAGGSRGGSRPARRGGTGAPKKAGGARKGSPAKRGGARKKGGARKSGRR